MRFYYFAVIITGIMILLNIAGLQTPGISLVKSFNIINSTGDLTLDNFKNSGLWANDSADDSTPGITFIFLGAVVAGLVLGAFGRTPDIRYITATLVFALSGLILGDIIFLFIQLKSYGITWITAVAGTILGCLAVGFVVTMKQFWEGNE